MSVGKLQIRRSRSPLMTAYQFMFYTFYQFFQSRAGAREGASAYKAGIAVAVMQVWLGGMFLAIYDLLNHVRYVPPAWVWIVWVLADAFFVYGVFDRRDRWKAYAKEFRHYSRKRLNVGRLLVATVFTLVVAGYFGLTWLVTTTMPPPVR